MNQKTHIWDEFLEQFSNVHLLQSSQWGSLKSKFGWDVSHIISGDTGVQILFRKMAFGFRWAYIPKGPIGNNWKGIWPLIDQECRCRRAVFLKVEPDLWDGDPLLTEFQSTGFHPSLHEIQPPRTIIVNLDASQDEILARMKQKTRYNIRLASKKGVDIHPSNDVQRFYKLIQDTGERGNFGVHSLEYYQMAYDIFSSVRMCELIVAEYQGELLAALMAFRYGKRAWYFYGASSERHRNLMAPYTVQWGAIKWAQSQGCLEYDLWGVPDFDLETLEAEFLNRNDGLWGVYRFKRGFGGELRRVIGTWDRVYNPVLYLIYRLWMKKIQS